MAQSKPTPGPWKATAAGIDAVTVSTTLRNGRRVPFRVGCCKDGDIDQVQANARLIAEAGTVYHETGLAPRQLAQQRAELLAALKELADTSRSYIQHADADDLEVLASARAAIAKAEGGAAC